MWWKHLLYIKFNIVQFILIKYVQIMMPSFKWSECDYCRNAHQQSDRFLPKKLKIEPSQHKHLFLVVVLWIIQSTVIISQKHDSFDSDKSVGFVSSWCCGFRKPSWHSSLTNFTTRAVEKISVYPWEVPSCVPQ